MIEWEDKFSMDISMIDEEHKKFIGILNKAIFAKEHNDNPEEIKEVLSEMVVNFEDVKRCLQGTTFEWMTDE